MNKIRIGNWNAEWASPTTPRGHAVREKLLSLDADILCLTEGKAELLPDDGFMIDAEADYGYRITLGRRKVMLWSKQPWRDVDQIGHEDLPTGRFVSGYTQTPIGEVLVLGVAICWRDAHVHTGKRNRNMWEDHLRYLKGLREIIKHNDTSNMLIVGDYNQRIPRKGTPTPVHEALLETFADVTIATTGFIQPVNVQMIDHLAHGAGLQASHISNWNRVNEAGHRLSDHHGLFVELVSTS